MNVKGTLYVTQAFLRLAAPNAVLIGVGTGAATMVFPKGSAYLSSKLAESKIFEVVQVENPSIRVHNVHPGGIQTQMAEKTQAAGLVAVPMDDGKLQSFASLLDKSAMLIKNKPPCLVHLWFGRLVLRRLSQRGSFCGAIGMWMS